MQWVDCDQYYGPDRRQARERRLRERRRIACGERIPAINTAILQLRMRAFDASGDRLPRFIGRVRGVATLALLHRESGIAEELMALSTQLSNLRGGDASELIYRALDRALTKAHG